MSTGATINPDFQSSRFATNQDLNHRIALLDIKIQGLQSQLSSAVTTQRECMYYLLGAMVIFAFCMLVAFR